MLGDHDCLRACLACLLSISPKDLPDPTNEYSKLKAKQTKIPEWIKFFNSIYQFYGFQIYETIRLKGFTIGVVESEINAHAIICENGLPCYNPDPFGKRYHKKDVEYYLRVRLLK